MTRVGTKAVLASAVFGLVVLSLGAKEVTSGIPAFRAAFDGTLAAEAVTTNRAYSPVPVRTKNLAFTAGVVGQAVSIPTNGWLEYAFDAAFLKSAGGTILFWAKTDWEYDGCCGYRDHALTDDGRWGQAGAARINRNFFELGTWRGIRLTTGAGLGGGYVEAWGGAGTRGRVRANEWHHYAMTFDRESGAYRFFIDGNMLCDRRFPKPVEGIFPKTFQVGCGGQRGGLFGGAVVGPRLGLGGAMDELRLYPYALAPDAITADYTRHVPYRMELLDWTVGEGETRAVRLRIRNITRAPFTRTFAFNTGDTVTLTVAPDELKAFTVTVRGAKPGLFTLAYNAGKTDFRQFQLDCLAKEDALKTPPSPPRGDTVPPAAQTLLREYDCTKDYPSNVFNECGSTIVRSSPCGTYREGKIFNPGTGFLYRFAILHKGRPHRLEVDYPDDAKREFSFGVWPENYARLHTGSLDCGGILTGVDHPNTMKMQTKSILFWPDSDTVAAGIIAYKPIEGSRPPAVARVRLYEITDLPPAPNAGAAADRRTVGVWDEDPTMDAQLVLNHAVNYKDADLEFWRVKWWRTIDYMRYQGLDTWTIKALAYNGDVTDMQATFKHASPHLTTDGRCPGWAEIGADMLDRAGMDIWIRCNHKCNSGDWLGPLGGGGPTKRYRFEDADGHAPASYGQVNFLRPEIRLAMKRTYRAYRDKFKVYKHFRGVTMNEAPGPYFDSIKVGYDDWTCSLFSRETGVTGLPKTARGRYDFLMGDPTRRAKWIEWRCAKVTELARELVAAFRDDGSKYELQFWVTCSLFCARDRDWFGWTADASLKRCGVDLKALSKIEGLRVIPMVRPDYFRAHGLYDTNEATFPYRAPFQELLRAAGVSEINLIRHSNLEIYPSMTATKNFWLRPHWMKPGNNLGGIANFYNYPTPHPDSKYALCSMVQFVADYDVQDIQHGFWGLPESGEHERFRTFYSQFRAIPRGRYALAPGVNEPVAVRVGTDGFYLVNREPYDVTVSWKRNGARESTLLKNCEIRHYSVPGHGRTHRLTIEDVRCAIPSDERRALDARIRTVEAHAEAHASDRPLADVAERARAAFAEGRYTTARGLLLSAPARAAFLAAQGLKVLCANPPSVVWAHEWGAEDETLPCHFLDSNWSQLGRDHLKIAENKRRLGKRPVGIAYSLCHDPVKGGLHLYARVGGGDPDELVFTFDPKNDNAHDDIGFSPDDVTYTFRKGGPIKGNNVGWEAFIPYAELKGFEPKPGAELGYTFTCRAIAKDGKGTFPVTIGSGRKGCVLRLSARRTGSGIVLGADSGKYRAEASVGETPKTFTFEFTPGKDATVNFSASTSWGGVGRLLDLKLTGAEPVKPLAVPCDLICYRKTLATYIKVKAGIPVRATATIAPREEWKK